MLIEDMDVYKMSYQLVLDIYKLTTKFPPEEKFGLISQIRRAAVSVISNLSEGSARITLADKKHFIAMARGSVAEIQTQISLSKDLNFIEQDTYELLNNNICRIRQMLSKLLDSVK